MHRSGSDHHVVTELKSIKHLLEKADHDYKGHRLKAVEEIGGAIHALEHGKHGHHPTALTQAGNGKSEKGTGEKGTGGKGPGLKEPQAESNKQVSEALKALEGVYRHLEREGHGEHHKHAAELIHKAIGQLKEAIKVEPKG